jgi:hypothetical protein
MSKLAELEKSLNVTKSTLERLHTTNIKPLHIPVSQIIAEIHKVDDHIAGFERNALRVRQMCNDLGIVLKTLKILASAGPGVLQVLGKIVGVIEKLPLLKSIETTVKNVLAGIEKVCKALGVDHG